MQTQRQSQQQALEPSLWEKFLASSTYAWAVHPDNFTIVVAGTVATVIIGFIGIIGIALLAAPNKTQPVPNALKTTSTPTMTPTTLSNYSPPPPVVAVTPIQRKRKVSKVKKTPLSNSTSAEDFESNSDLFDGVSNQSVSTDENLTSALTI